MVIIRGGVLEDVLGFEDVLEDTFWSPWPRGLKSSKIGLFSARGQHFFLNRWSFVDRLKKILEGVFYWRKTEKNFELFDNTCPCVLSPWLGLEHSCPWPREGLSSEGLYLALASNDFWVLGLGLEPCVIDSTSGNRQYKLSADSLQQLG